MKLIKLTGLEDEGFIYVNKSRITYMFTRKGKSFPFTEIFVDGATSIYVKETPEEIIEILYKEGNEALVKFGITND